MALCIPVSVGNFEVRRHCSARMAFEFCGGFILRWRHDPRKGKHFYHQGLVSQPFPYFEPRVCPREQQQQHVLLRSKRPRPAAFNPRPAIQLASPTSSESENFAESHPVNKKKKMKVLLPPVRVEANPNPNPSQGVRKCMHCEITKTPQWRAGPMGPKTLCNACGVRYKSGRLFPEYRPTASPTFVPALHSNSHKKVLEMRTMTGDSTSAIANTAEPELIPNKNPLTGLHLMD
ncbi:GATA transcription factor 8-like [Actinidia eriantha]|uniref:GATA transcription factor 8-like n=1 Tax=Actinidia eriantha TaxID=165200 RepID=UPI0025835BEB|nr:GATA transcription factor 8-like [Actinidia eriantha]